MRASNANTMSLVDVSVSNLLVWYDYHGRNPFGDAIGR